jgi:hypothetical protein
LMILKSWTKKTIFLFTLNSQLFPCIFSPWLCLPQRFTLFFRNERGKSWTCKYQRRLFSNFEEFGFELKKYKGRENFHFGVTCHLKSHFPL